MMRRLTCVQLATLFHCACYTQVCGWETSTVSSRRKCFKETVSLVVSTSVVSQALSTPSNAAEPAGELPLVLRDYTKLAPLGRVGPKSLEGKTLNLSLTELASRLETDLSLGHTGRGGYFISGDLDESIFREDCVFVDPTNRVTSLAQYRKALSILFDSSLSQVEVVKPIKVNEEGRTIEATIRSRGVLQLPWHPYITAYESNIQYTIDDNGLIAEQSQTWSKPALEALRESFTPGINRPAPISTLPPGTTEPKAVTRLFHYVNGRRPYEYTQAEQFEISKLVDQIVTEHGHRRSNTSEDNKFQPERLPGKWMLVYLQAGPTGAGIDRRIPLFPDFNFNNNFQVFSRDSILNIGQVFGPLIQVQVKGDLKEEIPGSYDVPKRLIAQINGGEICWKQKICLDLPISGEGLFDSVYLGERLRIGQNINGGGARVVQVKLAN